MIWALAYVAITIATTVLMLVAQYKKHGFDTAGDELFRAVIYLIAMTFWPFFFLAWGLIQLAKLIKLVS